MNPCEAILAAAPPELRQTAWSMARAVLEGATCPHDAGESVVASFPGDTAIFWAAVRLTWERQP